MLRYVRLTDPPTRGPELAATLVVYRIVGNIPAAVGMAIAALFALSSGSAAQDSAPPTPNVVIILADDLGWGDVQAMNPNSSIPTPNINSIAASGMRFTDAHSPSSVCSPTRYGLLTGRYAWRTRLTKGVLYGYDEPLIEPDRPTLGTLLQARGYRTAAIGKWHLGMAMPRLPEGEFEASAGTPGIDFGGVISDSPVDHGFDEFFGLSGSPSSPPYVYIRDDRFTAIPVRVQHSVTRPYESIKAGPLADDFVHEEVQNRLVEEAVAFVDRASQAEQPFFLYLPLTAPHVPILPDGRFRGTTSLGLYGDFVAQLDDAVGQVLSALEEAGELDDTLFVFTSDNGSYMGVTPHGFRDHTDSPWLLWYRRNNHRANGPWRGRKKEILEGGHRVPLLVRWPGVVVAGSETAATVTLTDLYATVADIVGDGALPGVAEDSVSLLPILRGESETRGVPVVHHSTSGMFAVRDGPWKLVLGNGTGDSSGIPFQRPWQLYDLSQDPAEEDNIAEDHPDVVARLEAVFESILRADSHDATLSALSLSGIDIGAFSGDATAYAASVAHVISSTTVTAAASHAGASVSISPGTAVSLAVGANEIAVTATAEDGYTTKTYTVTVTRASPPEASVAVLAPSVLAEEPDFAGAARRFADEMIARGTDRWGAEHSPQFASMLLRTDPPELLPDAVFLTDGPDKDRMHVQNLPNIYKSNNRANKITYRGGDVAVDAALYQLLYAIARDTGDSRYAAAADASLQWFLANAPLPNGLLPWGEHTGWDFRRERADYGYIFDERHEFHSRWPLWDRFIHLQPRVPAGEQTALEHFGRGLWRGSVSEAGESLLYDRHAYLFGFDRPDSGRWGRFSLFPRHGGYFIGLWSAALAATANEEFARWMEPRLERFVAALEQQTDGYGFAIYLDDRGVDFNPPQVGSLAVDLETAADLLALRVPALSQRMRELAALQDRAITRGGAPIYPKDAIHPKDALRRSDSNPATSEPYLEAFLVAANQYLEPIPPRELDRHVANVTQPGRIPEQSAEAIDVLLLASERFDGARARMYLNAARARAREAVDLFLTADSPLPSAIDREPVLLDGSRFPAFYSSYLGGDDLMWSLWRLSKASLSVVEAAFSVSAMPQAIAEGESATLTVAISNGVTFAAAQTIWLAASGTASASDYTGVPATLTLAAGESSVTATLAASADREEEEAETVTVTASHGASAIGSATLTITSVSHDATLGALSLSGIEIGVFSGAVTSYQASVDHAVEATTVTATASHPEAAVSIQPGPEVSLAVGANEIAVTVTAEDGTATQTYTVTVTRASLLEASIAEGSGPVTEGTAASFTVILDQAAPEALTVSVSVTESGSALSGTPPAAVAFAKGETSARLAVPTAGDRVVEADSSVTATVTAGSGYTVGRASSASVTVEDDDAATFAVSAEPESIAEGEASTLTVAISNGVTFAEAQTISLAASGTASASDYTGVPATLTLAAGESSVTATLAASADQEEEEAETVTVTASHGGSAIGSATLTITSVSHDATLGALSLSGIEIGAFSGAVTSYQASVDHAVEATTVTATASHSAATVSIEPGSEVSLAVGANEITVTVTAEDGSTTQTYTVTVTRASLLEASIAEGSGPVTEGTAASFTVILDQAAPEALTVSVSVTESGSALSGTPPAAVAFAKGETSARLAVPTAGDRVVEADSSVTATVTAGSGYTVGRASSASVTVEDDDAATFAVSAEPESIAEGEASTLTVAISNGVTFAEAQTISLAASGTASASDYTGVPATLTLAAGESSVTATLAASADQEEEEAETVTVTASHGGSAIGPATLTITSVSHDATLGALSLSGIEIGAFSGAVTSYQASVDHAVEATTVTATASHPEAAVSIQPGPEVSLAVGANEIAVTVTAEDGTATQTYTVTVTRAEEPPLPVVSIAAVEERVAGPIGEFTVSRTGPTAEPLELQVLFATSRSPRVQTLTVRFLPGQSRVTRQVQAGDNRLVEDDITVTWTLEEGEGYTVSAEHASASLVVEESDVPEFAVSVQPPEIAEGESATVTVAITNGVRFREAQTIALAVSGTASATDYTGVPATLTLAARESSVTATLAASADPEEEEAETVTVTASRGGSAIGSATLMITSVSHDASLGGLSLSGIEIGAFSGAVTSYEASVGHPVTTTTVTAMATHSAATVSIEPESEVSLAVGANVITITVTAEDGTATQTYTVTVTRAEEPALPVVSVAAVEERVTGPIGEFTVSRTGPTAEPLELQVLFATSRSPRDRTLTVRLLAGQSSVTRRVQGGDNKLVEDDITVTWTLQEGEGYTVSAERASASLVLEESDIPEFAVSVQPAEIAEGESATVTVAITNGVRFRQAQTIALAVSGTASGSDYTGVPETLGLPAYRTKATTATLTAAADQEQEADETVTITASHGGTAIGTATLTIAAGEAPPLTARFAGLPARHDGETAFAFELRFSEEILISYKTLRDAAFEVTGGAVIGARRLVRASNLRWEITVAPASDADVVLALPPTADCAAAGAVCTAGGKALAGRLEATVKGPGSEASGEGFSLDRENSSPSGIWSDGQTAWVADLADARLYAYSREHGERQPEKDIATEPSPMGLWSDGETLWVARLGGGLRAHRLAGGARLPAKDLALEANAAPGGVWSDGETAWVSEWLGDTVHAYRLSDGRREAGRDIELADGNLMPVGLWSDGETLWVADWRERVFAYRLSDGGREPSRDVAAGAGDTDPTGLWSGGGTLLSTSWDGGAVRAYRLPASPVLADGPGKGREGFLRARAASLPPIADPALAAAIGAALGKASGESPSPAELAGLETLQARNGGIRDLTGLEGATGLKELDLGFNPVADLRPLAALPALESLNLDGAAPDLPLLASLKGLKRLSLRNTGIDDLQPLASLAGLTELDVGDNRIAELSPLTGLTRLTVLRADRNRIADLWPLASLAGLEVLELGSNRVPDLQPLAGLTRLRALRLDGNGLTALHPLAGLDGLSDLGLAGNAVGSVGALADLGGLRRLDLRGTAVEDLRPLRALPSLVWLHVGGSRIQDLAPLDNLPGLTVAGREDRDSPGVAGKDDARASRR